MRLSAALPPDYDIWSFERGYAAARRDVTPAVREAVGARGTLYAWAAAQPARDVFHGRGEAYGVSLGGVRAVVRHARRGGVPALFSKDWFVGRPRAFREIELARRLKGRGVPTPDVLAGVVYAAGLGHRADVATSRVDGVDLATLFFGNRPPATGNRTAVWHAVGSAVRALHDAGYVHQDLQLRNLLVAFAEGPSPAAFLLDVDTCRPSDSRDRTARKSNLARLYRSWEKWNRSYGSRLTAEDREAFEAGYRESPE